MAYEILTIISADVLEKGQQEFSKKIQDLVKKDNGKILSESNLGTKKFAYPIKDQQTGTYLSIICELTPESIKSIKKQLQATDEIIKLFIFKMAEPSKEKAKKLKKIKPKLEKIAETKKIAETAKTEKITAKPKKVSQKIKPEKKPIIASEIEDEEDRLKKLDQKLDEILKE